MAFWFAVFIVHISSHSAHKESTSRDVDENKIAWFREWAAIYIIAILVGVAILARCWKAPRPASSLAGLGFRPKAYVSPSSESDLHKHDDPDWILEGAMIRTSLSGLRGKHRSIVFSYCGSCN